MASEVLHVASTSPTAGPIMLPIKLFDNRRSEFVAGSRLPGTISGVIALIAGVTTASEVPRSTPRTNRSQYCKRPKPMKATSAAVTIARRVRDQ